MSIGSKTRIKTVEQRRILDRDFSKLVVDRPVYRWFAVWSKVLKELEGQNIEVRGKKYKLGFSNHKWWKYINTNKIPKSPKFIRPDNKNLPRDINAFSNSFFNKYRDYFIERTTIVGSAGEVPNDYESFHFPPTLPIRDRLEIVRMQYSKKENKDTRHTADIVLDQTEESLMKRLFHTFRLDMTRDDLTNLDLYFQVEKIMRKGFVIPKIERVNATGAIGSRQRTTRGEFESSIRKTQRDRRFAKILFHLIQGLHTLKDHQLV